VVSNDSFSVNDELDRTLTEADIPHFQKVSPIMSSQNGNILEKPQAQARPATSSPTTLPTDAVISAEGGGGRLNTPRSKHTYIYISQVGQFIPVTFEHQNFKSAPLHSYVI
jgi:hypothetical protein